MPKYCGLKRKRKSSAILSCFKFAVDVLFRQSTIIIGTLPNRSPSFVIICSFHWSGFFHWITGSTSCTITYFADRCTTISSFMPLALLNNKNEDCYHVRNPIWYKLFNISFLFKQFIMQKLCLKDVKVAKKMYTLNLSQNQSMWTWIISDVCFRQNMVHLYLSNLLL